MSKTLATVKELSEFIRCSTDNVYRKVSEGKLPHLKYGGIIRFDPDQYPGLQEFLDTRSIEKKSPSL